MANLSPKGRAAARAKLTPRALALLERMGAGAFLPAYDKRTPKAVRELEGCGLVGLGGRVATMILCFAPIHGFKPLRREVIHNPADDK